MPVIGESRMQLVMPWLPERCFGMISGIKLSGIHSA
jgi:hypothetical protein